MAATCNRRTVNHYYDGGGDGLGAMAKAESLWPNLWAKDGSQ